MNLVLDAGVFIALENGDATTRARFAAARARGIGLVTTSPIVAQVWRDGRRQTMLARFLAATRIEAPDEGAARRAGELVGKARTSDVVDALLVGVARDGDTILTSDPHDLTALLAASRVRAAIVRV
jgi:predicted nucleic acid-binding protein